MKRQSRLQTLNNWSPKRAHSFAMRRLDHIRHLLTEIGGCYGDVDDGVVYECDQLVNGAFEDLQSALDDALAEGRSL